MADDVRLRAGEAPIFLLEESPGAWTNRAGIERDKRVIYWTQGRELPEGEMGEKS